MKLIQFCFRCGIKKSDNLFDLTSLSLQRHFLSKEENEYLKTFPNKAEMCERVRWYFSWLLALFRSSYKVVDYIIEVIKEIEVL
jgi:hypothetical protein